MIFQSAYSDAYELTQKMLLRHSNNLLVSIHTDYRPKFLYTVLASVLSLFSAGAQQCCCVCILYWSSARGGWGWLVSHILSYDHTSAGNAATAESHTTVHI